MYQQYRQTLPEQLLHQAEELESQGQIAQAQQFYQQLTRDFPQAAQAPQALLRSGRIWQFDQHDVQRALLSYLQLEHDYPESRLVVSAREEAAQLVKYSLRDFSRAIALYQRLLETSPEKGDVYLYEIADCYFRLDNYPQARIELETLLADYPQSELLADALYRKGGLLVLENRLAEARDDWRRLIDEYPQSSYASQVRFNLAKLLEEEGLLEEALNAYQQLTEVSRPEILEEKIEHLKQRIKKKKAI